MKEPFVQDNYYHIFNRGNNRQPLFLCAEDYVHFLNLYAIYAHPVLETFSWCLMKNHYHFCIRIKSSSELGCFDKRNRLEKDAGIKWQLFPKQDIPLQYQINPNPARMLNFMFDAYAKHFNFRYSATGAVFERGIKRRHIDSKNYLTEAIIYIHNNPVKHKITEIPEAYHWSSYHEIIHGNSRFCSMQSIMNIFGDRENFIATHKDRYGNGSEWGDC